MKHPEDIRAVDLMRALAGPCRTALLVVGPGVEALKPEVPQGNGHRHIGPFVGGAGTPLMPASRGNISLMIDLKSADRQERVQRAGASRNVVENPGSTCILYADGDNLSGALREPGPGRRGRPSFAFGGGLAGACASPARCLGQPGNVRRFAASADRSLRIAGARSGFNATSSPVVCWRDRRKP